MADADEDTIPRNGLPAEDADLSDETQDFRFLSILSAQDAKIPKRGEKDFEPHATELQNNILAASRHAMLTALSFQRVHPPKGYTLATYHPESNMAYAYSPRGPLFAKIGQVLSAKDDPLGDDELRGKRLWLHPEEVLYLLERGTMDVRWPPAPDDTDSKGLPMSLQGAYAMFLGNESSHGGSLTFERYSVYSGLKRLGYIVLRADTWDSCDPPNSPDCYPAIPPWSPRIGLGELWRKVFSSDQLSLSKTAAHGPVVTPARYRNYADIYRKLALIDFYDPTKQKQSSESTLPQTDSTFRVTFNVWKPGSTTFKKSAHGIPDFRIAVVNARETNVPTLDQLAALFETVPYEQPQPDAPFVQKLKHGYKNVILAIVDQGVVSYLKLSDAAFGREKLYERKGRPPNGKRGRGKRGK